MTASIPAVVNAREIDLLAVNTIRALAMDAVERAQSGHPGAPMGAAPMAFSVWTRFLKFDPDDPAWPDRDRFVLSAGHASMLLYSLLHLFGYDVSLDDLRNFRQWGSITPGHPEYGHTPGVEVTTGPLGQGFATGVGMALAERYLAERFNRPDYPVFDHHVYGICSDGDLMEGVSSEAASLAGHLRLGKLVYLYDSNGISIDGSTDLAFTEDVAARFSAYGWHVESVGDGNDLDAITKAVAVARDDPRPSLVIVPTHIGYGAPNKQDTSAAHGAPLGPDEVRAAKDRLGWPPDEEFLVPDEVTEHCREVADKGRAERRRWLALMGSYRLAHPDLAADLDRMLSGELPDRWDAELPRFTPEDGKIATRKASAAAINALAPKLPELVGGSADLAESNKTDIDDGGSFRPGHSGRNIHFGVREHAMGAAVNGMVIHGGVRAFGATFLIFSDYLRPALRLSALMEIPSIFVFTHDSVGLGEDGPTHQPIEHLPSLRAMPNLVDLRPADANETVAAWRFAVSHRGGPVALCLSRQGLPVLAETSGDLPPVERGAYVLHDPPGEGPPDIVLVATGSEVSLAREAADVLAAEGVAARVVSMPSWELFTRQPHSYRDEVLPPQVRARLAVEAAAPLGWREWVGGDGDVIGLHRFGASAPGGKVLAELGFNVDAVVDRARDVVSRTRSEDPGVH